MTGGRLELVGGDSGALLLMNLGESGDPGGRLIGVAAGGLVQAEGLERSGKLNRSQMGDYAWLRLQKN